MSPYKSFPTHLGLGDELLSGETQPLSLFACYYLFDEPPTPVSHQDMQAAVIYTTASGYCIFLGVQPTRPRAP
jgi:hypothetical protein